MNTTPYQEALGLALNDAAAANKLIDLDVGDFEAEQDKEIFAAIKTLKTERKPEKNGFASRAKDNPSHERKIEIMSD